MDRLLNRTVTVTRRSAGTDRYGNSAGTFQPVGTIRARIEERTGEENTEDQEATREAAVMWSRDGNINAADRISDGTATWEVDGQPIRRERIKDTHHYETRLKRLSQ